MRRLRFMPPSPFHYAPDQAHSARRLGPVCVQSVPAHLESGDASGRLARRQAQLGALLRQLKDRDQSEDCLNLNVYAPAEGKLARVERVA